MNDIDRSVESMDFAMRRRFAFINYLEIPQSVTSGREFVGKMHTSEKVFIQSIEGIQLD